MKVNYLLFKDKLKGEYAEAFDKIELYSNVTNIDFDTKNEMLSDLLDIFLNAQLEGKSIKKIIGSDIQKFCRLYFENYSFEQRIRKVTGAIKNVCFVLLVIELISLLLEMPKDFHAFIMLRTDVTAYLVGIFGAIIFSNIINIFMKKIMFSSKFFSTKIYNIVVTGSILLVIPVSLFMEHHSITIYVWPVLLAAGGYLVIYYIVKILEYRQLGTTRNKLEKGEKISFIQVVKGKIPNELIKRYEKINKKRQKKGKEIISHEEYMLILERGTKKDCYVVSSFHFIIIGIILIGIIAVAKDSSLNDTLVIGVILCICEMPIFLFARLMYVGVKARKMLLEECRTEGKDIFQLFAEK